ncbi:MAG: hypothetical protein MK052_04535 [Alphaproteobacteria bacterium]|nr:hypothetical protein [Alphaproteobacteria bacterium]
MHETPREAEILDEKMDDGIPNGGAVFGRRYLEGESFLDCATQNFSVGTRPPGKYQIDNDAIVCSLFVEM